MQQWSIGSNWASGLCFSPNGEWLLTVGEELELWDLAGERVRVVPRPSTRPRVRYTQPTFSSDGRFLAAICRLDRRLLIWHLQEKFNLEVVTIDDSYRFWAHFAPDSRTLLVGCYTTRRYEVDTWKRLPSIRTPIVPRRFVADRGGNFLISEGHSQFFCVGMSDMKPRGQWYHERLRLDSPQGFAVSPDGTLLVHAHERGWRLWGVPTGTELRTERSREAIQAIDFSPDGRLMALSHSNGVRLLETETWHEVTSFRWPIKAPVGLTFAPDGLRCAMIGADGKVVIWDVE